MTDAVAKNLKIENLVPKLVPHQPFHSLCKGYTVEKLDKSNLLLLSNWKKM